MTDDDPDDLDIRALLLSNDPPQSRDDYVLRLLGVQTALNLRVIMLLGRLSHGGKLADGEIPELLDYVQDQLDDMAGYVRLLDGGDGR